MCRYTTWKSNFKPKRRNPMSEGHTAIQVSPFNPEDREMTRNFFEKVADTVVQASELSKIVVQMRAELEQLRADIEKVREDNHRMDQQISELRSQRDELQEGLRQSRQENAELARSNEGLIISNNNLQRSLDGANEDKEHYFRDWKATLEELEVTQIKVNELEEELRRARDSVLHFEGRYAECQGKLDTLRSIFLS